MSSGLQVCAVEPDAEIRVRLKSIVQAVPEIAAIQFFKTIYQIEAAIKRGQACNVVLISDSLDEELVSQLRKILSQEPKAKDIAFVLLTSSDAVDRRSLLEGVLAGVDGVLSQPFSVESVQELVNLAHEVKKRRESLRERAAIRLLIEHMFEQINYIAYLKRQGHQGSLSVKLLQEMSSVLLEFEPELREKYYAELMVIGLKHSQQSTLSSGAYRGVSDRVRTQNARRAMRRVRSVMESAA